jgi:cytochrome c oxidase subunit II
LKKRSSRFWLITVFSIGLIALAIPLAVAMAQSGPNAPCPPNCMVSFDMPSIFEPASFEAGRIDALNRFILTIAGIIFVLVEGLLFLAVFRFRNRPADSAVQVHGNTKLEIAWTAAPAVILAVLMGFTFRTMGEVRAVTSENVMHVKAIGHRWFWEFQYPDLNIVTANELVVPVNTIIEVAVESVDVEHGFWVPELFGKVDAVPGYTNRVRFTPELVRNDFFGGQCTQFCGEQHAQMRFAVQVKSAGDFQTWAAQFQQPSAAAETLTGSAAAGRELFLAPTSQCVACHMVAGTVAAGVTGPNLTHIASRSFIAGGILARTDDNLHAWITNAPGIKSGTIMPYFGDTFTPQQISDLVAYLDTLK